MAEQGLMILQGNISPWAKRHLDLPVDSINLVERTLSRRAEDRYADLIEFRQALLKISNTSAQ